MTLLIHFNSAGTHADVSHGEEGAPRGAHRLLPGESYYGIPYDVWEWYAGRNVDVLALQFRASQVPSRASAAAEPARGGGRGRRRRLRPPSSLAEAIFVHGILGFGIPYAIGTALLGELMEPGYDPARLEELLFVKLGGGGHHRRASVRCLHLASYQTGARPRVTLANRRSRAELGPFAATPPPPRITR